MKKNKCTKCDITFSEGYRSCPRCAGTKLTTVTFAEAETLTDGRTELLESRGDLAHLNESQKKQMVELETYQAETKRMARLRDGYLAMGLTMSEAGIAAGLEVKITNKKDFWKNFEF